LRVLSGKVIPESQDALALYSAEMDGGYYFLQVSIGEELARFGYWELVAYPTIYQSPRVPIPQLQELVKKAQVALRGWNFPHTDKENARAFGQGIQSATKWNRYREGYRLYQSGLFLWKRAYWEDIEDGKTEDGRRTLSFISAIYSFTEFMLFFSRLYGELSPDNSLVIRVALHGCKDRELASFEFMVPFWPGHISGEEVISQQETLQVAELKAAPLDVAARMVKHVFHVFNWLDVTDGVIARWQQKLLKRDLS
jgi:hypothetical protein